jgi:hypothetical protein
MLPRGKIRGSGCQIKKPKNDRIFDQHPGVRICVEAQIVLHVPGSRDSVIPFPDENAKNFMFGRYPIKTPFDTRVRRA